MGTLEAWGAGGGGLISASVSPQRGVYLQGRSVKKEAPERGLNAAGCRDKVSTRVNHI